LQPASLLNGDACQASQVFQHCSEASLWTEETWQPLKFGWAVDNVCWHTQTLESEAAGLTFVVM